MTQQKKILIVDDEEIIRDILSDLLEEAGYDVMATDNPAHAIDMAGGTDCIVLDLKFSGDDDMAGTSLLRMFWENESFFTPVIIFSGYIYAGTVTKSLREIERLYGKGRKIADIIPKSSGFKKLISAVNCCFNRLESVTE
jgi:CheY-like chemotaxis protein